MALTVAELESLFTANTADFDRAAQRVEQRQRSLDGTKASLTVNADTSTAIRNIDRVESTARSLPDTEFQVEADTSRATGALNDLESDARSAGRDAGDAAGGGLSDGIVAALVSIPIAGAVVGIADSVIDATISAFQDGLAVEARNDRFAALTGLDEVTTARVARAAGEAYANAWGDSVESNLDAARIGIQIGLLNEDDSTRALQQQIEGLVGSAGLLNEDTTAVARAANTIISAGLADDLQGALDIILAGEQEGLDVAEDWLDTLNEYSSMWAQLGLDAPTTMGLISQALANGARDSDKAADALKEFMISVGTGDQAAIDALNRIGLDAGELTSAVAEGGEAGVDALDTVLDRLREIDRTTAMAVVPDIFKSPGEDLGASLYSMDVSTANVNTDGTALSAMATSADNDASRIESAVRNIEIVIEGVQAALASAFGDELGDLAEFVTNNREAVVQFLLDIANGAIDAGRSLVEAAAAGTEGFGTFVGTTGPQVMSLISTLVTGAWNAAEALSYLSPASAAAFQAMRLAIGDPREDMAALEETANNAFAAIESGSAIAADAMRTNIIEGVLDPSQAKLNEVGDQMLADARAHDANGRTATMLDDIAESGTATQETLQAVADSILAEAEAAARAGDDTEALTTRLQDNRDAFQATLKQAGYTTEEIAALTDELLGVPSEVATHVSADVEAAQDALDGLITTYNNKTIKVKVGAYGETTYVTGAGNAFQAIGHIVHPMAAGAVTGTALDPIAQMVPPGTLRVVGDRQDVAEAYIPMDRSPRSYALMYEAMRQMGIQPMAAGGITGGSAVSNAPTSHSQDVIVSGPVTVVTNDVDDLGDQMRRRAAENSWGGNR